MRKSFNSLRASAAGAWPPKSGVSILRLAIAGLMIANLVAAYFVIRPAGGSPAELRAELSDLRVQARQRRVVLDRAQGLVKKVETGRTEGQSFFDVYFLNQRTAASAIISELSEDAKTSGLQQREESFSYEPVEGSDSLNMMTVNAGFQGTYPQLIQMVHKLDQSKRLLIVESLQASPQQGSGLLNVNLRVNAFVRDEGGAASGGLEGGQP